MEAVVGSVQAGGAALGAGPRTRLGAGLLSLPSSPAAPSIADVIELLASVPMASDDAGKIDQIRGLEDLRCLAGARQADTTVAFDLSQRREQAAAGVPADEQGAGVAAQIARAGPAGVPRPGFEVAGPGQNPHRDAAHLRRVPQRAAE